MARELFIGTHGSEDPTKATLPFLMAGGAMDAGHEPAIVLAGDAVVVMDDAVANSVQGLGYHAIQGTACQGGRQKSTDLWLRALLPRPRDNRPGLGR